MARVLHLFSHPGQKSSRINSSMWRGSQSLEGITRVDLYARYPRYDIDIEAEQAQLLQHDIVVMQFPLFWYSCPALVKEWIDLVLEHGFAYGDGGDRLKGKHLLLAVTAGGPQDAYTPQGYQNFELRTFLTPFEQTARLCQMRFLAPYTLYGSLRAEPRLHVEGFRQLLLALRDDRLDLEQAVGLEVLTHENLPLNGK